MAINNEKLNELLTLWNSDEPRSNIPDEIALCRRQMVAVAIAMNAENPKEYHDAMRILKQKNNNFHSPVSPLYWDLANIKYNAYNSFFSSFQFLTNYNEKISKAQQPIIYENALACCVANADSVELYNHKQGLTLMKAAFPTLKLYSFHEHSINEYNDESRYIRDPNTGTFTLRKDKKAALIVFGKLQLDAIKQLDFFQSIRKNNQKSENSAYDKLEFNLSKLLVVRGDTRILDAHLKEEVKRLHCNKQDIIQTQRLLFYAIASGNIDMIQFIYDLHPAPKQTIAVYDENKNQHELTPLHFANFLQSKSSKQKHDAENNIFYNFKVNASAIIEFLNAKTASTSASMHSTLPPIPRPPAIRRNASLYDNRRLPVITPNSRQLDQTACVESLKEKLERTEEELQRTKEELESTKATLNLTTNEAQTANSKLRKMQIEGRELKGNSKTGKSRSGSRIFKR